MASTSTLGFLKAPVREHPYFVGRLELSPNGRYVALDKVDSMVTIFDIERKEIVLHKDIKPLSASFCFTPDSKNILIILSREILFFDLEKRRFFKELEFESPDAIFCMKFFKDGKRAVVGTGMGSIYIWNLETGEKQFLKTIYPKFVQEVEVVEISPDETKVLSIMQDYEDKEAPLNGHVIWDVATLKPIERIKLVNRNSRAWGKFTPDSKKIVIINESGYAHVIDAETGKVILGPRFKTDKGNPAFLTEDDKAYLIDPQTGKADFNQQVDSGGLLSDDRCGSSGLGLVANGKYFLTSSTQQYSVALWDTENYGIIDRYACRFQHNNCFGAFATHAEKNLVVTGDNDGSISVYKFNPEDLSFEMFWRPHPPKAGDITWINPMEGLGKSDEEIALMEKTLEADNKYRRNWRWWNPASWIRKQVK